MTGETIDRYRVGAKLGEGGMGVVYRAEDTKLERPVALKFLAPHLVSDAEVKQRFEREAKAAAALDHPNICHVYEIDEADGRSFIAMQLVEGESLDARIARGPLKLKEALRIGEQIAQGLEAAHGKGVVHRDIKPQNVMVGPDGRVTIMDFGLAHLADRSRITKADTSLGTVAYMSPEQAEGRQVDHRADIWALGCVIYEALAGERPFLGEFDQAVLYSVLNEQPEPLSARRTDVPVALELLVEKCLAKDAEERYQSAAELAVDLRSLGGKLASGSRVLLSKATVPAAAPVEYQDKIDAPDRGLAWLPWAIAASCALVAAAAWLLPSSDAQPERQVYRFTIPPPGGAVIKSFEVAPDGKSIVFVAEEEDAVRLWVRDFEESAARPIRGTEGIDALSTPFWSPDSRYVGYCANEKLMKVGVGGEPPTAIADAPNGRGGSWNENGVIVFAPRNHGSTSRLRSVSANGGPTRQVTFEDRANSHRSPFFLPDGDRFLFHARHTLEDTEILLGSLSSEEVRPLVPARNQAVFYQTDADSKTGFLLTVRDRVLLAFRFDPAQGEVQSDGIPMAQDVGSEFRMSRAFFSSSQNVLAYASQNVPFPQRSITWVDRSGRELSTIGLRFNYHSIRLSPDGSSAAVLGSNALSGPKARVFATETDNAAMSEFVWSTSPASWHPDGRRLLGIRGDTQGLLQPLVTLADGTTDPEPIGEASRGLPIEISPDGERLLVVRTGGPPLVAQSISNSGADHWNLLEGEFRVWYPRYSPDGRHIAYDSEQSGVREVYIREAGPSGARWRVSHRGGTRPVWRGDGRELYYLTESGDLMAVGLNWTEEGLSVSPPERLFSIQMMESEQWRWFPYDAAADGERFLVIQTLDETEPTPLQVVLNWDVELERLAAERGLTP